MTATIRTYEGEGKRPYKVELVIDSRVFIRHTATPKAQKEMATNLAKHWNIELETGA